MSKDYDKLGYRLALILSKFNSGEKLHIKDLATEFNVSARTIQRDINERFHYLPIVKENGYYSLEPYCIGKLSYDDIRNFATLSGIEKLYPSLTNNFMVDLLNTKLNKTYLIKGYEYEEVSNREKDFECVNIAIASHKKLSFTYNDKQRTVCPYKLVNTNGIWYLVADEDKNLKTYTFAKVAQPKGLEDSFSPKQEYLSIIEENKATWFSQNQIEVTLKIAIEVAPYFKRRDLLPKQTILEEHEDYIVLQAHVTYEEQILQVVRYWLPHIRIIAPLYLQEKLKKGLQEYLKI
ncbi:WYL domain-containing protein [Sulfurimonas sp. SAG-AH-194-I05]|nr:WYL domain-containing protein [Sulfurimonas sp. SAG-AH-194-I05]MDF1875209.1 WYL domain-containing protein [Sulfurimonas sp. SAG-AH-194-I05]